MFFGVFLDFSKKTQGFFFGFSRFLVLENLENPKNTICVFLDFSCFLLKNPKKHNDFFWIFLGFHRKIQTKNYRFFLIFKNVQKQKL